MAGLGDSYDTRQASLPGARKSGIPAHFMSFIKAFVSCWRLQASRMRP